MCLLKNSFFGKCIMPQTRSILSDADWRHNFGRVLSLLAEHQNINSQEIGRRLDRLDGSTGRARMADWSRYTKEGRIPTELQIKNLAASLRISSRILRVCAGYVDDIFEGVYSVVHTRKFGVWDHKISQRDAGIALMLSLFPSEGMHVGNPCSMFGWMLGNTIALNLEDDKGVQSGEHWNAVWLYEMKADNLIERSCLPNAEGLVWLGMPRTEPWTEYYMRASTQVDLASSVASDILAAGSLKIPKDNYLSSAQQIMHLKNLPLLLRIELVTSIVCHWVDDIVGGSECEVRENLHPWAHRTISGEAAKWVRGEVATRPDDFWL